MPSLKEPFAPWAKRGLRSQVAAVGKVLTCSSGGWEAIDRKALLALPLALLVLGTLFVQLLSQPFVRAALLASAPTDWTETQVAEALERFAFTQNVAFLTTPLLLVAKMVAISALVFLLVLLQKRDARYKKILSLVAIASLSPLAASWFVLAILKLRAVEAIHTIRDLQPPIGLAFFAPDASTSIFTLLNNVNVFEAWYVLVVGLGLAKLAALSRARALCLTGAVWVLCVAGQSWVLALFGR